jgi:hypothetical protein
MSVNEYYMEMEMLLQRARVCEPLEQTMQRFLHGLKYNIKSIVWHHRYHDMNDLIHHACEAEAQFAEEAQFKARTTLGSHFTPRPAAPTPSSCSDFRAPSSSRSDSNAKKYAPTASGPGSNMYTTRNCDMECHTCGGKDHFKRDCTNRKVMIVNEDTNEYETGDDADPDGSDDDDFGHDGADAYPSTANNIVCSQHVLNVSPTSESQRCNFFQTKALVGPDKACKLIIDGGSCRNLASKELCAKLKLKYIPHPHPYYIQWLSDNEEMKVSHMVRVDFEI